MAKRGRKPAPNILKIQAGVRRDRINPDTPPVIPGLAEPPVPLSAAARAEWDRILPLLNESGLVSLTDGVALAIYCVAYGRWVEAEGHMTREGRVLTDAKGVPRVSPWFKIARDASDDLRRMASEFGLTPSSRSSLRVPKQPGKPNSLEAFIEGCNRSRKRRDGPKDGA
ncbi:phage terminase small subunit P27 family [Paludisphaera mucosa]|uniref:Phage terminase small subunit P27 family n=1 Tax=Paludisphaera mucosa TaxID=3030827 RepID=A0ABT6FGF4_9BACT|nr:phage terminase small subunit P27 family [Paludisphaera mucosa]MDG3006617.1 phage terminase small subunit P27 family [Paludisphaera mucosa]